MSGTFNFNEVIDRQGTDSLKYDFKEARGLPEDILPLWVADMDFRAPQEVLDRLAERVKHGIFGYSDSGQAYFDALAGWYTRRFGWTPSQESLIKTPGIVYAICTAVRALTEPGDAILIQPPVYSPFAASVQTNERTLVENPLVYENGQYHIDFDDFEQKIINKNVRLFILCSPHNPVGRVWTETELRRLGDICLRHGVTILADEIHSDFVYPGHRHHVFVSLDPAFTQNTIVCTAPTKSFNLAGLQASNIFIENEDLRKRFQAEIRRTGYSQLTAMGLLATQTAYECGDAWMDALNAHLFENLGFMRTYIASNIPSIKLVEPEGTYLTWLDCHALGLSDSELNTFMTQKARIWLVAGNAFGTGGSGFQRLNIACSHSVLEEGLVRLKNAVATL